MKKCPKPSRNSNYLDLKNTRILIPLVAGLFLQVSNLAEGIVLPAEGKSFYGLDVPKTQDDFVNELSHFPDAYKYYGLGNVFEDAKDYDKAVENYKSATQCISESQPAATKLLSMAKIYFAIASAYGNKMDYDKALEHYRKADKWLPKEQEVSQVASEIFYGMGTAYQQKREFDKAIENYQKSLATIPEALSTSTSSWSKVDIYVAMGSSYQGNGDYEKALEHYKKALSIKSEPRIFYDMATLFQKRDKLDEALKNYHAAYSALAHGNWRNNSAEPTESEILFAMGTAYEAQHDLKYALASYEKAVKLHPQKEQVEWVSLSNLYCLIGGIYQIRHRFDQALDSYQKALSCLAQTQDDLYGITETEIYLRMARVYRVKGDSKKAEEYYQKLLPKNSEPYVR